MAKKGHNPVIHQKLNKRLPVLSIFIEILAQKGKKFYFKKSHI